MENGSRSTCRSLKAALTGEGTEPIRWQKNVMLVLSRTETPCWNASRSRIGREPDHLNSRWRDAPSELKTWSFSSGSLAEMREAAPCAEIVAADSPQLSTVLVPVLRRYSKSTHQYSRVLGGIGSESLRRRCGRRSHVPKQWQRTFRNAKGLTGAALRLTLSVVSKGNRFQPSPWSAALTCDRAQPKMRVQGHFTMIARA